MDYSQIFPSELWKQKRMLSQGQMKTVYLCKKFLKCEYICRQDQPTKAIHICTFHNLFIYYKKKYASSPIQLMFYSIIICANIYFSAATSEQMFLLFILSLKQVKTQFYQLSLPFLTELNDSLNLITRILRSKPVSATLQIVCPKFCQTR